MATHGGNTHEVFNQSSDFVDLNAFASDPLLQVLTRGLPASTAETLDRLGRYIGSREAQDLARLANVEVPQLRRFDEKGRRIETVEYHPAYHALMRRSACEGLHSSIWAAPPEEDGVRHTARAARFYMTAGMECGHLCPLTMTSASVAALAAEPHLRDAWLPGIAGRGYDPSDRAASAKTGLLLGMGMTEKQGGTDVRANTTVAVADGEGWRLTGHKWFLSAPMSDGFLVLAQTEEGLTCFLLPRRLPDGSLNALRLQRLKNKLGNRSNASSEAEFDSAFAWKVGEPGRGIRTIMEMVTLTRLDCAVASAGLMRGALAEAVHHCRERQVFGRLLIDQPQMTRVLADMALDVAGATALAFRLAHAFDAGAGDAASAAWARTMTPVTKYWVCKLAPPLTYEAMECLGGNGYVEDGRLSRAYREAPVNAIWEGSGNVMALDLARVVGRSPDFLVTVIDEVADVLRQSAPDLRRGLLAALSAARSGEADARLLTERLALAAAAAELHCTGLAKVADAFARTRLHGQWRHTYGTIDLGGDDRDIVDTLFPPIR